MSHSKKELRESLLKQRDSFDRDERMAMDSIFCSKLLKYIDNTDGPSAVFGFLPFGSEPNLREFYDELEAREIPIGMPVIESEGIMEFYPWSSKGEMRLNRYGIEEPVRDGEVPLVADSATMIIVPGLAFDRQGYRIGYGGGYYDQYLVAVPESQKVGVCYEPMLLDEVPREEWDQPVQKLFIAET